jgi:hypothetical protein
MAFALYLVARLRKEDHGWTAERAGATPKAGTATGGAGDEPISYAKAMMPVLPLALLVLTLPQLGLTTALLPKGLTVLQAMVIGTIATAAIARLSPSKVINS